MSETRTDREPTRDTEPERDTLNTDAMQWVSAIVALAGLGLVAYPFMFESTEAAVWNDTMLGTAIFLLAGYNFYRLSKNRLASTGAAALAALLGLAALASPMFVEMGSDELATATMAGGLVVAILSTYNAYANNKADRPEDRAVRT
jgi:peptidoglycan/LPS O-acetylase OafA/YrhL